MRCEGEEWVELLEEFWESGNYARLRRWLHEVRKAAAGWEEGFAEAKERPRCFFNAQTAVRLVVHGDDFTHSKSKKELEKIKGKLEEWCDIKDRGTMGTAKRERSRRLRW